MVRIQEIASKANLGELGEKLGQKATAVLAKRGFDWKKVSGDSLRAAARDAAQAFTGHFRPETAVASPTDASPTADAPAATPTGA